MSREALAERPAAMDVDYRWDERLGGRPRLRPGERAADRCWTVAQFAAYAAHTRTPEFATALDEVLRESAAADVGVM